jgi:hypothetical protein
VFQGGSQALIQLPEKLLASSAKKFALYAKNHGQLIDCLVLKKPLTSAPARRNFPIRRNHNILCVAAAGKPKPWVCLVRKIGVQPGVAWAFGGGANGENKINRRTQSGLPAEALTGSFSPRQTYYRN